MFDGRFRRSVEVVTTPIGRGLVRAGFSADVLTGSGLVFACATAWAIAVGLHWGAIGLLTSAIFVPVLWVMLALTTMTALGRFARVWRAADRPTPVEPRFHPRREHVRRRRTLSRASRH